MRVAIIAIEEKNSLPYLEYYTSVLTDNKIEYDCIFWNRFNDGINKKIKNEYTIYIKRRPGTYRIFKILPFYNYKKILENIIQKEQYTHLIILTTLTGVLLYNTLLNNFKNKYILDIRDYTYEKYFLYKRLVMKLINNSMFTSISSPGFMKFLDSSRKIINCHNLCDNIETPAVVINDIRDKKKIVIGYVGGIRYFDINSSLLKQFSNNSKFELFYAGRANLDCDLENFCRINKIYNARFIGAFNNDEKFNLYKNVDIINAIYGNNSLEVTTALPNRLYDAAILRKPILVSVGTYVAKVVEEYELGLAVDVNKDVVKVVGDYVKSFDAEKFELNCHKFLNDIKKEQDNFIKHIKKFVTA